MNTQYLKNKRILLFAPSFFGYDKEFLNGLQKAGADVDLYNERISENTFVKILIRLNPNYLSGYVEKYYDNIIEENKDKNYDYVFFVSVEAATPKIIGKLRSAFSNARFYMYSWDSVENKKYLKDVMPLFDRVWSFDKSDSDKYNIDFLPLFYSNEYSEIASAGVLQKYDALFVGTIHSDRYSFLKCIEKQVHAQKGLVYYWQYFPSILLYIKMKVQSHRFCKEARFRDFRFESLNKEQLLKLIAESKAVIDSNHPSQCGLTMRTFETLGAKRKLITTNVNVKEYDFYRESNILVVDRLSPVIDSDFLNSEYEEIPSDIYMKYSLDGWLYHIFSE